MVSSCGNLVESDDMAWNFQQGQRVPSVAEIAAHLQDSEIRAEAGLDDPVVADSTVSGPAEQSGGGPSQKLEIYEKIQALSRSRADLRRVMDIVMEHFGVEPIVELVRMASQETLDPSLRAKIWMELQSYRMPKLKSVEHTGTVNHQHNVVIVRFGEDGKVRTEKQLRTSVPTEAIREEAS